MKLLVDIPNGLYANLSKIQNGSIATKRILQCVKDGEKAEQRIREMLEDIKEEAEKMKEMYDAPRDVYEPDFWMREGIDGVLDIIDKYISAE